MMASSARRAMIQLLPSSSLWPSTAETALTSSNDTDEMAGAAEAATGAAIIEVAAREIAAFLWKFIVFSIHWNFDLLESSLRITSRTRFRPALLCIAARYCKAFCRTAAFLMNLLNREKVVQKAWPTPGAPVRRVRWSRDSPDVRGCRGATPLHVPRSMASPIRPDVRQHEPKMR